MATLEVIDLCSDDSIIGLSAQSNTCMTTRAPLKDTTAQANLQYNQFLDSDPDLDGLLPLPAAKRRRLEQACIEPVKNGYDVPPAMRFSSILKPMQHHETIPSSPIANSWSDVRAPRPRSPCSDIPSSGDEDLIPHLRPSPRTTTGLSQATTTLIAEIVGNVSKGKQTLSGIKTGSEKRDEVHLGDPGPSTTKTSKAALRKESQEARKTAKEVVKAQSNERKRLERERKVMERELAVKHAEANKPRWDKKISTSEMIVDIPSSIANSHMKTELQRILDELQVSLSTYDGKVVNVVKWRRRSKTIFNRDKNHWELRPEVILDEPHVLCISSAKDFTAKVQSEDGLAEVHQQLSQVKHSFPGCQILYIIEGLETFLKKQRTLKNRSYIASVRQGEPAAAQNVASAGYIDDERIEEVLVQLPITHDCFIFHTVNALETAEWIGEFTQHISTVPYKHERNNIDSQFCMENGQVKAGDDVRDIFLRALQQVVRVTAPVAYGIEAQYSDITSLSTAFEKDGDLAVEDLQKCANRDGTASNARIGPQISRRLARVFLGQDPDSIDI